MLTFDIPINQYFRIHFYGVFDICTSQNNFHYIIFAINCAIFRTISHALCLSLQIGNYCAKFCSLFRLIMHYQTLRQLAFLLLGMLLKGMFQLYVTR